MKKKNKETPRFGVFADIVYGPVACCWCRGGGRCEVVMATYLKSGDLLRKKKGRGVGVDRV